VYKKNIKVTIPVKIQKSRSEIIVISFPGVSNPLIILYISNNIPIKSPPVIEVKK
jgi:hypothetical protein